MSTKHFLCAAMSALSLATLAAASLKFDVKTDPADAVATCGAKATFVVTISNADGSRATNGLVNAFLDNFGPKQLAAAEWDLAQTNVFALAGTLDAPGFLRIRFDPEPAQSATGAKVWSVAFDPEKIRKGSPSPADFDAYWAAERARIRREVPLDPQVERLPEASTKDYDFYRVSFATYGRRVHGFMSVPTDKSKAKFPVRIGVNAAGFGCWTNGLDARGDAICLQMSVYPFPMDLKWKENGLQKTYDAMNDALCKRYGCESGCWDAGISVSREEYFYHAVLLGIDRAVDWIVARPDADASRVVYEGTSQGGGLGICLTELNHVFARAAFFVPAITDTMGYLQGRQSGWPSIVESNSGSPEAKATAAKWAPYFDGANFASRITCPVRVAVGFSDTTCPPCAVYATYNEIRVKDKAILHGLDMTHDCFGDFYAQLGAWNRAAW